MRIAHSNTNGDGHNHRDALSDAYVPANGMGASCASAY
jgi:hypothetical protein